MLPALNLYSPGLLLSLCYRCLAGTSDKADAALNRRRLEDLKAELTMLGLDLSTTRADLQIAQDKAVRAERELEDSTVDLRLFDEQHPPPSPRKGLLGNRSGRMDPQLRQQRTELVRLAELARDAAGRTAARVTELTNNEAQLGTRLKELQGGQRELSQGLRGLYTAAVLDCCAQGEWDQAQRRIEELRQALRGELSVAVLAVLATFFQHGAAAGRQSMLEVRTVLDNHPPQARRVLEALMAYSEGARLDRGELKLMLPGQLEWDGLYQLYRCIAVLSGWQVEDTGEGDGLTRQTLRALAVGLQESLITDGDESAAGARLKEVAAEGDVVVRALCAHRALQEGALAAVLDCADVSALPGMAAKRKKDPPGLLDQVRLIEFPAWPAVLKDDWRALLCCQVLLAANTCADRAVLERWLAESYGWPKSDFYWWVLARVKGDATLERNLSGAPGQLVSVARI